MEKETEKQLGLIDIIQQEIGIQYTGKSKKDAQKYISENIKKLPFDTFLNDWAIQNGY